MDSANFYQLGMGQSPQGLTSIHEWYPSLHLNNDDYNRYMNEILPNSKELVKEKANFVDMRYDDHEYESCDCPSSTNNARINAVDLNENLWVRNSFSSNQQICLQQLSRDQFIYSGACPAASSSNNYVLNNISPCSSSMGLVSNSSPYFSTHNKGLNLGVDFMSYVSNGDNCSHSSKEINVSSSTYGRSHHDPCYSPSSTGSNKTLASRNAAINPGTKRDSTPSRKRPSHEAAAKKPRTVQSHSSCPLPKVGKEKIGDRIAALHKLVAPFGKTDTATVLTEAIGYIQFLHHQIQTLSMPCEKPSHSDAHRCIEEVILRKQLEAKQDLRSRGLCLVPFSVGSYVGFGGTSW